MADRKPDDHDGAKSGLAPGEGAPERRDKEGGPARPVNEEDVFGGAERTHDEDVQSPRTKP